MTDEDAYAGLCLHGALPLVRDMDEDTGLRFARIGVDAPSDCVASAAGLPDADMTLRVFGSPDHVAPYLAALSEHGGNVFSSLVSPAARGVTFALVMRHDRPRAPGTALDDAVRLVGAGEGFKTAWAEYREDAIKSRDVARERDSVERKWTAEKDVISSLPKSFLMGVERDGVEFYADSGVTGLLLTRDEAGHALKWKEMQVEMPEDLSAKFGRVLASEGVSNDGIGRYAMRLPELSPEAVAGAIAAARRVLVARGGFVDVAGTRSRLAAAMRDPRSAKVLTRAVSGLPVLQFSRDEPAAQASPRSGTPQTLAGSLLADLVKLNLMRPAWIPDRKKFGERAHARPPGIYVATDAARDLVAGMVTDAADKAGNTRIPRAEPTPSPDGTLRQALAALAVEDVSADLLSAAAAAEERLPVEGAALGTLLGQGHEAWMPVALCVAAGIATYDDAETLRLVERAAAAPGP